MTPEYCQQHMDQVKDLATVKQTVLDMKNSFDDIKGRMVAHINEGERPGGVRDRLSKLEWEVSEFKKRFWWSSIMGGVIGALIGSGSSDVVINFLNWVMNIK